MPALYLVQNLAGVARLVSSMWASISQAGARPEVLELAVISPLAQVADQLIASAIFLAGGGKGWCRDYVGIQPAANCFRDLCIYSFKPYG